ncbi:phosphotransferase [Vibrio gallaecicus]|uniref:phosphotransferase n=1 Tax=Vibrio gallaecicus TaxID=552386 RepID=UPI0010C9DA25|nr:phosphotransferase [Vibrio gallaecicus]MDN3616066.1 phosphotransferase [Vibrio gallaecicus]
MNFTYQNIVSSLDIEASFNVEVIQGLWGGYGELVRLSFCDEKNLDNGNLGNDDLSKPNAITPPNLIVKHVSLPDKSEHPKGWNTERSHLRKVGSYQVETSWYQDHTQVFDPYCPVPKGLLCKQSDNEWLIVMQDLADLGFPNTHQTANKMQRNACLEWLANFHAKHIGTEANDVWESGTYWHLDTRPDELNALQDLPLKAQAEAIDRKLKQASFQTLVHGDAKLANFCFNLKGDKVAAVDFQYVGHGCAMKDVALFMSSAVEPEYCDGLESELLESYFGYLQEALTRYQPHLSFPEVEASWRPMFYVAWADFHRFVKGWSPNHWKINSYTESMANSVVNEFQSERKNESKK